MKQIAYLVEKEHHEMLKKIKSVTGAGISYSLRKAIEHYYGTLFSKENGNLLNAPESKVKVNDGVET